MSAATNKRDIKKIAQAVFAGERAALGQAITLIESNLPAEREQAQELLAACLAHSGQSIRIGITGAPGVGKSSFIESFGQYLLEEGRRVAVLAIDPSSVASKGSILGDKTRMQRLAQHEHAFVRPSPAANSLSGVAFRTREVMLVCEAAGYDTILIETVGVGQSQVDVNSMVDFLLLLVLANSGDILQGIKRGIMEIADLIVITKADGKDESISAAKAACLEYRAAVAIQSKQEHNWQTQVLTHSAHQAMGNAEIWQHLQKYLQLSQANGYFSQNRHRQTLAWIREKLLEHFTNLLDGWMENVAKNFKQEQVNEQIMQGLVTPDALARQLWEQHYMQNSRSY